MVGRWTGTPFLDRPLAYYDVIVFQKPIIKDALRFAPIRYAIFWLLDCLGRIVLWKTLFLQ